MLVTGASGSGKGTIVNKVCQKYGFTRLKSYTTRPPRKRNVTDFSSHIFISDEQFNKLKNLVAYTEYNGFKYCGTSAQVEQSDFYIIDPEGVAYFKQHYKGNKQIVTVFIDAEESTRFCRMKARTHGDEVKVTTEAIERIKYDRMVFKDWKEQCDIVIDNNNVDINDAVDKLAQIMKEEAVEC